MECSRLAPGDRHNLDNLNSMRKGHDIVQRMADQVIFKLENIGDMSPSVLRRLCEAIGKTSLPEEIKSSLQSAVDEQALADSTRGLKAVVKPQSLSLRTIWNYLGKQELLSVRSPPLPTMAQVMVKRMRVIGMRSCKEMTEKTCCASLIHTLVERGEPEPTPHDTYKLGQYFLDAFNASLQTPLAAGPSRYPTSPDELGEDIVIDLCLAFVAHSPKAFC